MHRGDARTMCGSDVRRVGMTPDDWARAEMLAVRLGGSVTTYPVGTAAVSVMWTSRDGHTVTVTGATAADAIGALTTRILGDV